MATTPQTVVRAPRRRRRATLQEKARRHLWMHFTRMGAYDEQHEVPIIVRGEGCYVYDEHGKRYLDGLSALFCVNAGHGRAELGEAAAAQAKELGFYTNWSYAHPRAIELAARIAALAPGDLNRVFFTSGGSEAVESAWKLARQYHKLTRRPAEARRSSRARSPTTAPPSARSRSPASRRCARRSSRSCRARCHVPNTNELPLARGPRPALGRRRRSRSGSSSRARRRSPP